MQVLNGNPARVRSSKVPAALELDDSGNLYTSTSTVSDEDSDSVAAYTKAASYVALSASGVVAAAPTTYCGYIVTASSTGVISIYDNASAASGTRLVASKTVAAGDSITLNIPVATLNGLYLSIESGTCTVLTLFRKIAAA